MTTPTTRYYTKTGAFTDVPLAGAELTAYNTMIAQSSSPAVIQSEYIAILAAHRYEVQNGGTIVSGNHFKTDVESRTALMAVFIIANANPGYQCNWKMADGSFVDLTASQIIASGLGVLAFVQKCFDSEKTVTDNIANYANGAEAIAAFDALMAS